MPRLRRYVRYPPAPVCPSCLSESSGVGENVRPRDPAVMGGVPPHLLPELPPPYTVAAVQLTEGPILIANLLDADERPPVLDMPVSVTFEEVADADGDGRWWIYQWTGDEGVPVRNRTRRRQLAPAGPSTGCGSSICPYSWSARGRPCSWVRWAPRSSTWSSPTSIGKTCPPGVPPDHQRHIDRLHHMEHEQAGALPGSQGGKGPGVRLPADRNL